MALPLAALVALAVEVRDRVPLLQQQELLTRVAVAVVPVETLLAQAQTAALVLSLFVLHTP